MPADHILTLLIAERDKLNSAIEVLQGPVKQRGRQPKNAISSEPTQPAKTKRRKFSAAQRKRQAERMKAFWAAKKKAAAKAHSKAASNPKKAAKAA
jgi:hypothetical protein